jgi:fatty-acyl-CoA synthase
VDAADVPLQRLVFPVDAGGAGGTHVCLRWVRAERDVRCIADHGRDASVRRADRHVDCCSTRPTSRSAIDRRCDLQHRRRAAAGKRAGRHGGPGFNVTHLYGLTETYGPAVVNEWKREWDAARRAAKAQKKARQGVRYTRWKT